MGESDPSSHNTPSEDILAEEFEFDGADGMSYQEFLQRIRRIAFREGKSRDSAWMVELAPLHLSGDALTWYETLEADVQEDWHLFRKAMARQYGGNAETKADGQYQIDPLSLITSELRVP
ncbi:hypothetical protein M407DRAFT_34461 [Tulasnella calospora MUT 4182]|uniref:Retrotransposon gag domain-containing protein n=1 Tax=Tulasnella calospora MUT 4182 TaxID=1051891 RepID=A0A0C3K3F3_9AGAM|nr:hypothetical protein M407DRAFT_34461 [Tulasnella calospora MUT 4182]